MGVPSTPLPKPPRNDAERAADAEFYRRERDAPPRRTGTDYGPLLFGAALLMGFFA